MIPRLSAFILAAVVIAAGGAVHADSPETGTIRGHVQDAKSGEPLTFCNVVLQSVGGTMTDMKGDFVLRGIRVGTYHLVISRIGHKSFEQDSLVVSAGDTTVVNAMLDPAPVQMDPVVVTATRVEQTARMAPASVSVVDQKEIEQRAPATFDQAIEEVPGLNAFRSAPISTQSIQIRGSSDVLGGGVGNRVLLMIDGRPSLTTDSGGAFWSLVPTQFIDRVEIVKGAFSSLYGSTAMGGVINVLTRRPGKKTVARLDMKLGFFEKPPPAIRYTDKTSLQSEITAGLSGPIGHSKRDMRYLFSASRKSSDGYSQNTGYEFYDLYGKLIFNLNAQRRLELTLGGGHAMNDYPHPWENNDHPLEVKPEYADDIQTKNYYSTDLHYDALSSDNTRLSTRMYYFHHEQVSDFKKGGFIVPDQFKTEIKGNKVGFLTQVDRRIGQSNRLVGGVDIQIDMVQSDTTLYGDHQINNYAVFVQDDVDLTKSVTATIGLRYDWNHQVAGRTLEQVSPKVALVWQARESLALRALFAQAFRAPTIAELYLRYEPGALTEFIPNPNLTAEHIVASGEFGMRWNPDPKLGMDFAVYRYDYEDMIYWVDITEQLGSSTRVFQVRNLNSATMSGFEGTVDSRLGALTLTGSYTYLDARDTSPGRSNDVLAYRPKHTAMLGADLTLGRWLLHGDGRYRSKLEEVFLFPRQAPDAYVVASGNVQFNVNASLLASVKVNNIFDEQYEELDRYRMPGRNWMFGISFRM